MSVQITALYASLLGLWLIVLSVRVILYRRESSISLGHKENQMLERRIRAQGNFAEYAPMAILFLGLLELQGGPAWALHVLALLLSACLSFSGKLFQLPGKIPPGKVQKSAGSVLLYFQQFPKNF